MKVRRERAYDETLEKVMKRFWRHGYSATSLTDLEKATGLLRGSLYHAYGGKREMFMEALSRYDRLHREARISVLEDNPSPRGAVLAFFEAAAQDVARDGCLMVNSALELGAHDKDVASFVDRSCVGIEDFFRRSIERGQASGEISALVEPEGVAKTLIGMLLGLRVFARFCPDRTRLQPMVDQAAALLPPPAVGEENQSGR